MNYVDGTLPPHGTRYTLPALLRTVRGAWRHAMGLDGKHVRR